MTVEEEVLARVKPTQDEERRILGIVEKLRARVAGAEAAKGRGIQPYLVGSIAKGTHLKDPDADMFLLFDPEVPREELEKVGLAIGREAISGREHYAEHPYIKGEFMGLKVDVVPAYRIVDSSQKMTAVDRTPFHTEYVKASLRPELRDDVRLLKAFMKGIGTYGADAKTEGFSGYLCELLIIRSGGFGRLLEDAANWRPGMRFELGDRTGRKFDAPMTFIDPVDANRNVASALSGDNLAIFTAAARAYLAGPRLEFFFPRPAKTLAPAALKKALAGRGGMLFVAMPRPDLVDDILFPQLRKFERNLAQHLANAGFGVVDTHSHAGADELALVLELDTLELPEGMLHRGPPVSVASNSADFLERWNGSPDAMSAPFVKDGCWHLFVRRRHPDALGCLRDCLEGIDAGKDLNRQKGAASVSAKPGGKAAAEALSRYLDRRMPWDR